LGLWTLTCLALSAFACAAPAPRRLLSLPLLALSFGALSACAWTSLALAALTSRALALAARRLGALAALALASLAAGLATAAAALALLLLALVRRGGLVVGLAIGLSKTRGWAGDQKGRTTCHQQMIEPHGVFLPGVPRERLRCSNDATANSILMTSKSLP
jgi:hypothetical protein